MHPRSKSWPCRGSITVTFDLRAKTAANADTKEGLRWITTATAAPKLAGKLAKRAPSASTPPADVPTRTTSRRGSCAAFISSSQGIVGAKLSEPIRLERLPNASDHLRCAAGPRSKSGRNVLRVGTLVLAL